MSAISSITTYLLAILLIMKFTKGNRGFSALEFQQIVAEFPQLAAFQNDPMKLLLIHSKQRNFY